MLPKTYNIVMNFILSLRVYVVLIIFQLITFHNRGFAQTTKVEYELGAISFDRVAPLIKELSQSGDYLKSNEVDIQLTRTLNTKIKIVTTGTRIKELSGNEVFTILKPSTLILISNGLRATAVALDENGILLTNYHVLEMFGDTTGKNNQPLFAMTSDGVFYPVKQILTCSKVNDLAIIRVGGLGTTKMKPVSMGFTAPEGSDVYAMGHPAYITYFFSKGIIARNFIREPSTNKPDEDFRMAVTADYSLGMSGGPMVDNMGNLIGLISSANALYGDPQQKLNPQMSFKSGIPVIAIRRLLE
jgi:serine protease Do